MKPNSLATVALFASALLYVGAARATLPAADASPETAISASFERSIGARPEAIRMSEIGLYEVYVGGRIFYTDAKGHYLIDGTLVAIANKENLTARRLAEITPAPAAKPRLDLRTLQLKDAIKTVRGNGGAKQGRVIYAFEDPNCGYCKRFHAELAQLTDFTVYTFPMPILGAGSLDKAKAIWCASDRAKAWAGAMVNAPVSGTTACDTSAIERNQALGKRLGITGTPTLFFANGERNSGYLPAAALEQKFSTLPK